MNIASSTAAPVQSTQRPTNMQQAEQTERQARPRDTEAQKPQATPPTPVVNSQGQTTGRLLNVTA